MSIPVRRVIVRATRQVATINASDFDARIHLDPDAPKHPGGRPPLPAERRRAVRRKTYLTADDDADLRGIAEMTGASVSELIYAGVQRIRSEYRRALTEFRGPTNTAAE